LGIQFDGGVMICADLLGSYGSCAMFRNLPRVFKVNDCTIFGGSGDYADLQFMKDVIEQKTLVKYKKLCEDNLIKAFFPNLLETKMLA